MELAVDRSIINLCWKLHFPYALNTCLFPDEQRIGCEFWDIHSMTKFCFFLYMQDFVSLSQVWYYCWNKEKSPGWWRKIWQKTCAQVGEEELGRQTFAGYSSVCVIPSLFLVGIFSNALGLSRSSGPFRVFSQFIIHNCPSFNILPLSF